MSDRKTRISIVSGDMEYHINITDNKEGIRIKAENERDEDLPTFFHAVCKGVYGGLESGMKRYAIMVSLLDVLGIDPDSSLKTEIDDMNIEEMIDILKNKKE